MSQTAAPIQLADFPRRYFDAWNGRDSSAIEPLLAPEFSWVDPLLPRPLDSAEGAHGFMQGSWQGFSDLRFEPIGEPLVDEDHQRVAHVWRMLATHDGEGVPAGVGPTGRSIDVIGTDVWTLDEQGRATHIRACYDALTIMGQLGLQ